MGDRVLGGIGLVLAGFFIWQTTVIQESFISDPVGPKGFPIIIGVLLALASLVILIRPDAPPAWPSVGRLTEILIAAAVLVAYAELLPEIGFVIATAVVAAYFSWRLGASPVEAVLAGIGIAAGIYVVFHLLLGLSLAKGPLGF